jgi:hypothetical protein
MMKTWRTVHELEWEISEVERSRETAVRLGRMQPGVEVSDLCRRKGLNPVLYYAWRKPLLGSASRGFEDRNAKPDAMPHLFFAIGAASSSGGAHGPD